MDVILAPTDDRKQLTEQLWQKWVSHRWHKTAFLTFAETLPLDLLRHLISQK